jgi:hypothetical protein
VSGRFGVGEAAEENFAADAEGAGDGEDGVQGHVAFASFDLAEIGPVNPRL